MVQVVECMTSQPPSEVVESQVREAGLLERPRGGHRGVRVSWASERVKTLDTIADYDRVRQQSPMVSFGQTDHGHGKVRWNLETD